MITLILLAATALVVAVIVSLILVICGIIAFAAIGPIIVDLWVAIFVVTTLVKLFKRVERR